MKAAISEKAKQYDEWRQFSSVLDPKQVSVWLKAIEAWENDPSNPNPFGPQTKGSYMLA
jgi:hypothetical protein